MGEIHELFVLALSLVWFAGATPDQNQLFLGFARCVIICEEKRCSIGCSEWGFQGCLAALTVVAEMITELISF